MGFPWRRRQEQPQFRALTPTYAPKKDDFMDGRDRRLMLFQPGELLGTMTVSGRVSLYEVKDDGSLEDCTP